MSTLPGSENARGAKRRAEMKHPCRELGPARPWRSTRNGYASQADREAGSRVGVKSASRSRASDHRLYVAYALNTRVRAHGAVPVCPEHGSSPS